MATNNAVNVGLAGSTGSGSFVGSTAPTMTLPSINNVLDGYTTTATAAGTTTLTVNSNLLQYFTGSTTQTIVAPVTSTLVLGQQYIFQNQSTGILTVNSSGGNLIGKVQAGARAFIQCVLTSGTTAASWQFVQFGTGNVLNIQNFTASGTYTPTTGMTHCLVEMVGGGGAGGGSQAASASTANAGSGGGSGAYSRSYLTSAQIGTSQVVTIGAGGTGVSNGTGNAGGTTSLGSLVTAPGGAGGIRTTLSTISGACIGGAGGSTGTADLMFAGGPGGPAVVMIGNGFTSGNGGNSYWASGALGVQGTNSAGVAATANTGAGGSGAVVGAVTGANQAGGNGATGLIIITEFS